MAVTGLQNVSAFSPSFFGESRSTSSVLRMWRALESDHVVSHPHVSRREINDSGSECFSTTTYVGQGSENCDDISEDSDEIENQGVTGSETEHQDNNSIISERTSDIGETQRERVRQIFREWMNNGGKVHSSNGFHLGTDGLGENERGRVRIIREWVQMSTQQMSNRGSHGDDVSLADSQIEQVREGLVINRTKIGTRRPIMRLCGRQTLLDLLLRAKMAREKELQGLSERRTVSDFVHRNRIQALLRGRFLRNQRLTPDERPPLKAATELGLQKQRTVSDLREGFLSRLDSSASTSSNNADEDSPSGPEIRGEPGVTCGVTEVTVIHTASDLESSADRSMSQQIFMEQVSEIHESFLGNEAGDLEVVLDFGSDRGGEEPDLNTDTSEQGTLTDADRLSSRHDAQINATVANNVVLETEDVAQTFEIFNEHNELRNDADDFHEAASPATEIEENENEELNMQNASAEVEEYQESVIEIEDRAWQQQLAFNERMEDGSREEMSRNWHVNSTSQLFDESRGTSGDAGEQDHMLESREQWPTHDLQEAIDSWLDMPSEEVGSSVGRIGTLYFPDEDNVHSVELRELFSRRRVSSLLRSSFRESLNQVLQSHVERLGHASGEWDLDNTSSPAFVEQEEQEQLNAYQNLPAYDGADRNPFAPTPTLVTAPEPLWNEDFHSANWAHNSFNQQFGTEWEVINDLRIDMARLQQGMNHMQNMLEACMEMQIELQRTVRQEVSAALNHSIFSNDAVDCKGTTLCDESQWDQVRRGICCLCSSSNIDSLLYRCGHMCTCSKCAENLVERVGKCPMCEAPVVEAVRAYFVQ